MNDPQVLLQIPPSARLVDAKKEVNGVQVVTKREGGQETTRTAAGKTHPRKATIDEQDSLT